MRDVNWTLATCREFDPDIWFLPEHEDTALRICGGCPISADCLHVALTRPEKWGVWGGATEASRMRYGFKRSRVKCPSCLSTQVDQSIDHREVCRACGLSWRV